MIRIRHMLAEDRDEMGFLFGKKGLNLLRGIRKEISFCHTMEECIQ